MLLVAKNLGKQYFIEKSFFSSKKTIIHALIDINFKLAEREVLGVIGETGSGKTTLAKLLVKLIEPTTGQINYSDRNIRRSIQMVFQNPYASLNPRMKIAHTLKEPFLIHEKTDHKNMNLKIESLLEKVNMNKDCLSRYPDEFSGGQRQRIAIARAIAINPKILVCDEPTASLDLSVQAQILNLFKRLKQEFQLSYIFISHNIEVISFIADKILILYEGRQVERGPKHKIFKKPIHPYTKILLGREIGEARKTEFKSDNGCNFYHICKNRTEICQESIPKEIKIEEGHYVSCHNLR
ncbi:MAG: oligopeptide/dipeptide ABC transporter ATP-binding protein [Candidatus Omnitrophota bacterium]